MVHEGAEFIVRLDAGAVSHALVDVAQLIVQGGYRQTRRREGLLEFVDRGRDDGQARRGNQGAGECGGDVG